MGELKYNICLKNWYYLQSLKNNIRRSSTDISTRKLYRVSTNFSRNWRLILRDCAMEYDKFNCREEKTLVTTGTGLSWKICIIYF